MNQDNKLTYFVQVSKNQWYRTQQKGKHRTVVSVFRYTEDEHHEEHCYLTFPPVTSHVGDKVYYYAEVPKKLYDRYHVGPKALFKKTTLSTMVWNEENFSNLRAG